MDTFKCNFQAKDYLCPPSAHVYGHIHHFLSFILGSCMIGLFLQMVTICHRECSIITITM